MIERAIENWLTRTNESTPPVGQQGNFGRNVLRGFDATQADIGVQRQFRITEKLGLRFRAEFFNILNHPNFGNPNISRIADGLDEQLAP